MSAAANTAARDLWAQVDQTWAVDATYRKGAQGAGSPVRVRVTPNTPSVVRPGMGLSAGASDPTHVRYPFKVMLGAPRAGETVNADGVTPSGAVQRPRVGDTIEVPGSAVNRPDVATVVLRIAGEIRGDGTGGAYWQAEVAA